MKMLKISLPNNNHTGFFIADHDKSRYGDYSVVERFRSQNRLRKVMSILRKFANGGDRRFLGNLDLSVMRSEDGREYELLTYSRHWEGRASYYAGVYIAVERLKRSIRGKKKAS